MLCDPVALVISVVRDPDTSFLGSRDRDLPLFANQPKILLCTSPKDCVDLVVRIASRRSGNSHAVLRFDLGGGAIGLPLTFTINWDSLDSVKRLQDSPCKTVKTRQFPGHSEYLTPGILTQQGIPFLCLQS